MRIAVFCGASPGNVPEIQAVTQELGRALAARDIGIVFGGGRVGLMGMVADAALAAGGEVVGVIPGFMVEKELAHDGITELIIVGDMHERKLRMHQLSQAVVALPGGFGTMDELFELLTWRQLAIHAKPMGLLNVNGYYDPLLSQVARMERDGFLHGQTNLISATTPDALIDRLLTEL